MITYQWYLNGNLIPGATGSTLLIDPITEPDFGTYTVAVTSDGNTVVYTAGILGVALIVIEQSSDFNILTPITKLDRVSRQCDPTTLVALPGKWGVLDTDGSVINPVVDSDNNKLNVLFGSRSLHYNIYEGNDVKVGRIATIEGEGFQYKVGVTGYDGQIDQSDLCVVSTNSTSIGKLVSVNYTAETGAYEIVARCEQIIGDHLVFRTTTPQMITLT